MNLSEPRDDDRYDELTYKTRQCVRHSRVYVVTYADPHQGCPDCLDEGEYERALVKAGAA